jgi:hypothetical protein
MENEEEEKSKTNQNFEPENYEPIVKEANVFDLGFEEYSNDKIENSKNKTNQSINKNTDTFNLSSTTYNDKKQNQQNEKKYIYDSFEEMYNKSKRNLIKINFDSMDVKRASKYKEILNEIKLLDSINYENEDKKRNYIPYKFFNTNSTFYNSNYSTDLNTKSSSFRNTNNNSFFRNNNNQSLLSELKYPSKKTYFNDLKLSHVNFSSYGGEFNKRRFFNFEKGKYPLNHYYKKEENFFGDVLGKKDKAKFLRFPNNSSFNTSFYKNNDKNVSLEKLKNW